MTTINNELKYWVGFSIISGIGRVRFAQMENYFGSLEQAWQKGDSSDFKKAGLDRPTVDAVIEGRPNISLENEMEKLDRNGVQVLTFRDPAYPVRLKEIYDYPPILYIKGTIMPQDEYSVAVVGTRHLTAYGQQVTDEIVTDLAKRKITIVSGLAKGIDGVAHRSALKADGRTLAVFGCGLDIVYPTDHQGLADHITTKGALISEYPLGTKPRPEYFPRRNRIISGLSLGVLVVEAGESSGAVITANLALEQNREVFAIPGNIMSPVSVGTNKLIQDGAKLVTGYMDILEELNLTAVAHQLEMKEVIPATETETILMKHLSFEPIHIDDVCRGAELGISTVSSTLAMMELKGMVRQVGNMNYVLSREAREEYRVKLE